MSNKIIADVSEDIKQKLSDIAHANRESMKTVLIRLIEQEYKRLKK